MSSDPKSESENRDLTRGEGPSLSPHSSDGEPDSDDAYELTVERRFASFSSPYPPPHLLQQYNDVIPGLGEKIIAKIDSEQAHRHGLENKFFDQSESNRVANDARARRGQIFAFIVALTGMAVTSLAIIYDQPWVGAFVGGGTFGLLVTSFLKGPQDLTASQEDDDDDDE